MAWNEWKRMFDTYMDAIDSELFSDKRKTALLIHSLGAEGQRRYSKLKELTNYAEGATEFEKANLKLANEYKVVRNKRAERYVFRRRAQSQCESITEYIAALRDLASTCDFGDFLEDAICDQMIEKMYNHKIRERLLADENIDLDKAIVIAVRLENAIRDAKSMDPHRLSDDFDKSVNVVKYNKHYMRKENTRGRNPKHDKSQDKKTCYRCGSTQHKANYPQCAALQQKCRKCNKIGHFEKVCFSKGTDVHVVQQLHNESQNYVLNVKADNTKAQPNIKCPQCMVQIQGTAVNILVDSGSPYTIIPNELYENLFADIELCDSDITPGGYGGTPIQMRGYFQATVQYKARKTEERVYVSMHGATILGWPTQAKLKIILDPAQIQPVLQTTPSVVDEFEDVFDQSNNVPAKHFTHRIQWREDATPVQHKVRNIPLSVQPALSEEIQRLQNGGIIEPIEASKWVSPIVVARKPNGKIRMCVDLRDVNSKIIVETHPLPNINEMLMTLDESEIYTTLDLSSAYHQIKLTDESKDITAFITPDGLYRYTRVPYGLASASSLFQRMMHTIFMDVKGVCYFQDDILIHANSQSEHDQILRIVLSKLRHHGLIVNKDKCKFGQTSVDYLGHTITPDGITPKEDLVRAIIDAPAPEGKDQLRSFLGLCEYISKFIRNFANKVAPLRLMMKKDVPFKWESQHEKVFNELKLDISYSNNQQAVPVETGPDIAVDNGQIPNVVETRKSCRVKRIPRRLME